MAKGSQVFDESASQLFAQNNATFGPGPTFGLPPLLLSETVYKASINGLMFCKLKGLTAEVGSRVRWHVAGQVRDPAVVRLDWKALELHQLVADIDGNWQGSGPGLLWML